MWLHRLDMALSEEPAASGSLVRARHSLGHLLAYFLDPGTAWGLQFKDMIDQFLRENRRHNERKCNELTSSLQKCRNRRTKLHDEFDAVSKTMEVIFEGWSQREMEQGLNTLQTSLNMVETSITKFKDLIEDCRMVEEEVRHVEEDEAHREEEIHQEEEEITNVKMVEEVVCRPPVGKEEASTNQRPFCHSMRNDRGRTGEGLSQSEAFLPLGVESTIVCYWRPV